MESTTMKIFYRNDNTICTNLACSHLNTKVVFCRYFKEEYVGCWLVRESVFNAMHSFHLHTNYESSIFRLINCL